MSTPPLRLRSQGKPGGLIRVTTIIGLIFGLAFGICSVSGISLSNGGNARAARLLISTALIMGAICLACLLVIGLIVFLRSRRKAKFPIERVP